jgi:PTH1 family peptidyl-tRNA hydrolase
MMLKKWIFGLGNPEDKYKNTRHNAGFLAVSYYAEALKAGPWLEKNESLYLKLAGTDSQAYLVMPQTYMNESGRSLLKWKSKEGLEAAQLLVVFDDMDLPLGKIRYRPEGSGGSHNGMASMIECLGTEKFSRLRIGIGKPQNPEDWADYVLRRFNTEEAPQLDSVLQKSAELMKDWMAGLPHESLMSKYNG